MIRGAIASGYRHGINLREGVLNPAARDHAFETVINNINHREVQIGKSPMECRKDWITRAEN